MSFQVKVSNTKQYALKRLRKPSKMLYFVLRWNKLKKFQHNFARLAPKIIEWNYSENFRNNATFRKIFIFCARYGENKIFCIYTETFKKVQEAKSPKARKISGILNCKIKEIYKKLTVFCNFFKRTRIKNSFVLVGSGQSHFKIQGAWGSTPEC